MAVKIRLRRVGRKKAPMYRIVVADSKSPRDGKFIEIVGQYQPRTGEQAINLDTERVNHWLSVGAQPTDTVRSLLDESERDAITPLAAAMAIAHRRLMPGAA